MLRQLLGFSIAEIPGGALIVAENLFLLMLRKPLLYGQSRIYFVDTKNLIRIL